MAGPTISGVCTGRVSDLTRFAIQAKGPDGKWTRKPLAYRESNNVVVSISSMLVNKYP